MNGGVITVVPTHTDCCPYWFTRWQLSSWWSWMEILPQSVLWKLEFPQQKICHNKRSILPKVKQSRGVFLQRNCDLPTCLLREGSVPQGLLLSLISFYWWCPYCRYSPGHRVTEGKAVFGTQLLCSALAATLTLNQLKIFPHSKTDNYF